MCSSFTFSKGRHSIILSVLQLHVIDTHVIPYVCLVLFKLYFVATLDIYMIIKLVCYLKAIWQWFALSHRNETLTGLFFSLGTYGVCGCAFVFWWQRVTIDSHSSTLCLCVSGSGWLKEYSVCARMHTQGCVDKIVPPIFPQKSACGDHHVVCVCVWLCACVHAGGMPAPEQSPVTEEGHLLTIRDSSTGRNMEADSNTANNILASVKEQVLRLFPVRTLLTAC